MGEQVQYFANFGFAVFTASDNGILAYQASGAGSVTQVVWLDRSGKQLDVLGPPADYLRPRLSRDGRRVAVDVGDPQTGRFDIWIYDLARRVPTRFTFEADSVFPIWSPDDGRNSSPPTSRPRTAPTPVTMPNPNLTIRRRRVYQ